MWSTWVHSRWRPSTKFPSILNVKIKGRLMKGPVRRLLNESLTTLWWIFKETQGVFFPKDMLGRPPQWQISLDFWIDTATIRVSLNFPPNRKFWTLTTTNVYKRTTERIMTFNWRLYYPFPTVVCFVIGKFTFPTSLVNLINPLGICSQTFHDRLEITNEKKRKKDRRLRFSDWNLFIDGWPKVVVLVFSRGSDRPTHTCHGSYTRGNRSLTSVLHESTLNTFHLDVFRNHFRSPISRL